MKLFSIFHDFLSTKIVLLLLPNIFCSNAVIDVNCTELSEYICRKKILLALNNYLSSGYNYNTHTLPVSYPQQLPINVSASMTFSSIQQIDEVLGSMSLAIYLVLIWKDRLLTWDPVCMNECMYIYACIFI